MREFQKRALKGSACLHVWSFGRRGSGFQSFGVRQLGSFFENEALKIWDRGGL